jgi:hypothetical protein
MDVETSAGELGDYDERECYVPWDHSPDECRYGEPDETFKSELEQ